MRSASSVPVAEIVLEMEARCTLAVMNVLFADRSRPNAHKLTAMMSTIPEIPTMVLRFVPVMFVPLHLLLGGSNVKKI